MLKVAVRLMFCIVFTASWLSESRAQTIISLVGGGWELGATSLEGGTGATVSWTQTSRFADVTITAKLGGIFGTPAVGSGSAFLTRRFGLGTTTNDELASVSFPFPANATNVVLFTGLTLEAGTWFLTIAGDAGSSGGNWLQGCRTELTCADGVVMGTPATFYESAPYVPATENAAFGMVFHHFSVIAGTNGVPEERPLTPHDRNQHPMTREQSFTVRESESLTFRFDAVDPEGDAFELSIRNRVFLGRLNAKEFSGSLDDLMCFPPTEVVYTAVDAGDELIEYAAADHTGHSINRVLIKILGPALTISCTNGTVELQWTSQSPFWQVMFASSPEVIDWEWLDMAPIVEGDKRVVRAPVSPSRRFFRLQRY